MKRPRCSDGAPHRYSMVKPEHRGHWSCTCGRWGTIHIIGNAVIACYRCAAGWCQKHIETRRP